MATFRQCSIDLSAFLNVCKIEKGLNSQTSVTQTKTTTKSPFFRHAVHSGIYFGVNYMVNNNNYYYNNNN